MKKKVGIVTFFCALLVSGSIMLNYYNSNKVYFKFKANIKGKFSYVDRIDISNYGPYCSLFIYLDETGCDYEQIEPVFIHIIQDINKETNYQYFMNRHSKIGELVYFNVRFYRKSNEEQLFKFCSNYRDFHLWELDGNESMKYDVSDYEKH